MAPHKNYSSKTQQIPIFSSPIFQLFWITKSKSDNSRKVPPRKSKKKCVPVFKKEPENFANSNLFFFLESDFEFELERTTINNKSETTIQQRLVPRYTQFSAAALVRLLQHISHTFQRLQQPPETHLITEP